jgi:hypothetical protein
VAVVEAVLNRLLVLMAVQVAAAVHLVLRLATAAQVRKAVTAEATAVSFHLFIPVVAAVEKVVTAATQLQQVRLVLVELA